MSRIAYLDCLAGISGDMTLGALVDVGVPQAALGEAIQRLHLPGVSLRCSKASQHGIVGTRCVVRLPKHLRRYRPQAMIQIIRKAKLPQWVIEQASAMVHRLAKVEQRIHQDDRLDQLGDPDTIVDLVGAVFGFHHLGVDAIYASPIRLGRGFVDGHDGRIPIPGPATLELLRGFPVDLTPIPVELTTPTGAVIVSSLARPSPRPPLMIIERIGYGVGGYRLKELPDLLRIVIGRISR